MNQAPTQESIKCGFDESNPYRFILSKSLFVSFSFKDGIERRHNNQSQYGGE